MKKKTLFMLILLIVVLINIFPLKPSNRYPHSDDIKNYTLKNTYIDFFGQPVTKYTTDYSFKTKDKGSIVVVSDDWGNEIPIFSNFPPSLIAKYDSNLEQIWSIGGIDGILIDNYHVYIYDVVELNDRSIVGVGKAILTDNSNEGDLVLLKLNQNGDIISLKLFSQLEIQDYDSIYNNYQDIEMVVTKDGGYTLTMYNNVHGKKIIMHFNEDGILMWCVNNIYDYNFTNLIKDQDDNYYLKGRLLNINKIIKISSTGVLLWENNYDFNITSLYISTKNQLIASGYQDGERILNKKVSYFLLLENDYNANYIYNNTTCAITAQIDHNTGKVNWKNDYNFDNRDVYLNKSTTEDSDGNLYSYIQADYLKYDNPEMIVKYSSNGKRLGEMFINTSFGDTSAYVSNEIAVSITDDRLSFFSIKNNGYRFINLDDVTWQKANLIDYSKLQIYQNALIFRLWINRIFLIGGIGYLIYIELKYKKAHKYYPFE